MTIRDSSGRIAWHIQLLIFLGSTLFAIGVAYASFATKTEVIQMDKDVRLELRQELDSRIKGSEKNVYDRLDRMEAKQDVILKYLLDNPRKLATKQTN